MICYGEEEEEEEEDRFIAREEAHLLYGAFSRRG